jgi:protein-S-isoprenylcysteine O-methyltransferase Ste14
MRLVYEFLFPVIWVVFLVYWRLMAANVKATTRTEPAASQMIRAILFLTAIVLLSFPNIPVPWLYRFLWPYGTATMWGGAFLSFWGGAAITVAGLLFSIWARVYLGRNWSHAVTIKEGHELITSGPYALARHPIYTGLLTGFLGTAIAIAQVRGALAFAMVFIPLLLKLRLEERFMREQFGEKYEAYARRVKALVPFVL